MAATKRSKQSAPRAPEENVITVTQVIPMEGEEGSLNPMYVQMAKRSLDLPLRAAFELFARGVEALEVVAGALASISEVMEEKHEAQKKGLLN